ncbi:hypothetical protein [Microbispora hainanensis]|uniref:WD40 repeat domain-containing protein n=1 Tax=Microbispora hainanensis TaxID=568844 RepID=A0ABZ1SMT0_9ACTN|nr:hypothetical protein [Microbispora hainanensis]
MSAGTDKIIEDYTNTPEFPKLAQRISARRISQHFAPRSLPSSGQTKKVLPYRLAIGARGKLLGILYQDGYIEVWNLKNDSQVAHMQGQAPEIVNSLSPLESSLSISPDGTWLATGIAPVIALWDIRSGKLAHRIRTSFDKELEFTPDSHLLVIAADAAIFFLEMSSFHLYARNLSAGSKFLGFGSSVDIGFRKRDGAVVIGAEDLFVVLPKHDEVQIVHCGCGGIGTVSDDGERVVFTGGLVSEWDTTEEKEVSNWRPRYGSASAAYIHAKEIVVTGSSTSSLEHPSPVLEFFKHSTRQRVGEVSLSDNVGMTDGITFDEPSGLLIASYQDTRKIIVAYDVVK